MRTIKVKAREGIKVPKEDRGYIEQDAVTVPRTAYYQRRIKDGDLVEETETASAKASAKTVKSTTEGAE